MKDPSVEGLRGASALAVLGYHLFGFGVVASSYFRLGLGGGFAAVYVFFALSAYLLVGRATAWRAYYASRLLRIFPTWLVVLPLYVAVGLVPLSPWAVGAIQNWFPSMAGIPNPSWTLSVEVVFYAALPAWRWLFDRVPLAAWGGCLGLTATATLLPSGPVDLVVPALCLFAYATGTLARLGRLPSVAPSAGAALLVGAFALATVAPDLAPLAVGGAAGWALTALPARLGRLAALGAVAYPLYLVGFPIQAALDGMVADPWLVAALTVPLAVGAAVLLHRAVESPALRLLRRPT